MLITCNCITNNIKKMMIRCCIKRFELQASNIPTLFTYTRALSLSQVLLLFFCINIRFLGEGSSSNPKFDREVSKV
ncbi:hypothetical protein MtrunA17_Chr3g0080081 [Medicago truncatula]|uniref:Uncharacterized protein n=1 Tax=Medicago truncatula TaxID=3880 RepID=A0A396INK5_MEDTR|nr:hypothetical protein MtrunA17_Chr3g0080081 [Medicago truncatula]